MNKKSLYILGLLLGAMTLVYGEISTKGLAHCGGLFLFDSDTQKFRGSFCQIADTTHVGKYNAFASITHYRAYALWKDDWTLSFNSNRTVGSAGINADFSHIGFQVSASSFPSLTASITTHTEDSSLYATASIERGNPDLTKIRWESENETDEIHLIDALWEVDYLRKGFTLGGNFKSNSAYAELNHIGTKPNNQDREYYFKDSSQVWLWNVGYAHQFESTQLSASYLGLSADVNLIGNVHREENIKRFFYLPVDASLHYGDIRWENKLWGLQAHGLKTNIEVSRDLRRLHETLAPNRILPTSLSQALSFSFLQRNYLVDTDIDIAVATFGGYFSPEFKVTTHTSIIPRLDVHGYYTYDEISINKTSETTSLIAYKAEDEHWDWDFESFGTIAGIGLSIEKQFKESQRKISFEWNASQVIPFQADLHKHSDKKNSGSDKDITNKKSSAGVESSGAFKNGFATHLGVSVLF